MLIYEGFDIITRGNQHLQHLMFPNQALSTSTLNVNYIHQCSLSLKPEDIDFQS